jgi:hypothetical protein
MLVTEIQHIALIRFWPETAAVLDTFPDVADVRAAFGASRVQLYGPSARPPGDRQVPRRDGRHRTA